MSVNFKDTLCDHSAVWTPLINDAPSGAIAEFGCYDGGSTRILAKYGRPVFTFDTFDGIPGQDYYPTIDSDNEPGKFKPSGPVSEMFADYPNIYPIQGRYAETLVLPIIQHLKFAFAYIDCDYFMSYRQVFAYLIPRLTGRTFMCDDFQCEGARLAIAEFLETHPEWKFNPETQVFTRG